MQQQSNALAADAQILSTTRGIWGGRVRSAYAYDPRLAAIPRTLCRGTGALDD